MEAKAAGAPLRLTAERTVLRKTETQLVVKVVNAESNEQTLIVISPNAQFDERVVDEVLACPSWTRTVSSSGAEYSYFAVGPVASQASVKVEIISPAKDAVIARYAPQLRRLQVETPAEYRNKLIPPVAEWIGNIVAGTHEVDRTLLRTDAFVVQADFKWTTFPSREHNGAVYAQGIVFNLALKSLRDLDASHVPLLLEMKRAGLEQLRQKFQVEPDTVRVFFHCEHFAPPYIRKASENLLGVLCPNAPSFGQGTWHLKRPAAILAVAHAFLLVGQPHCRCWRGARAPRGRRCVSVDQGWCFAMAFG